MIICKDCRCFHPVSVSDRYCGDCCIGDMKNPIAINADITDCCLFEPKQHKKAQKRNTDIDHTAILRLCNEIEMIIVTVCDTGYTLQGGDVEAIMKRTKAIRKELTGDAGA